MNELEQRLKSLIIDRYGSMKRFSEIINMPWSTLDSILKRGVANSNITNVLKITKELNLNAESLVDGKIEAPPDNAPAHVIAAHFDGDEYTEEQIERIRAFAAFIKNEEKK